MHLERSENCMENYVDALQTIAQEIHEKEQNNRYFRNTVPERPQEAQLCWICEGQFGMNRDLEDDEVIDHCYYSGKFWDSRTQNSISKGRLSILFHSWRTICHL